MDYPKNQMEMERLFSDEEQCREFLLKLRFPDGFRCEKCDCPEYWKLGRDRWRCAECLVEITALSGTVFHKSHLPLTIWFRACWWLTNQKQGVSALGLQKALGLGSYRTAWMMMQKLRVAMVRPSRNRLQGALEVDEIYIGGPDKEGKKYRSSKRLILVAVEKDGAVIGRIRMKLIPDTSGAILLAGVQEMVEPDSLIQTDGWHGYNGLKKHGYKHEVISMPEGRKQRREANALPKVHRVASLFKRWLLGTYQGRVDPKHLQNYLEEFVFRFNRRTSKSRGLLFRRLLENCIQTEAPTYKSLIAKP